MKGLLVAALAAPLLTTAMPASAQRYDFALDFGNPVFSYGFGTKSAAGDRFISFTAFNAANTYAGGCAGEATFACITSGGNSLAPGDLPAVGVNTGATPIYPYTLSLYPGELFVHPGTDATQSVIVRFTAPRTGTYQIDAFFYRIDDAGRSNGVNLTTAYNGGVVANGAIPYVGEGALAVQRRRNLAAGDTLWYGFDNNGELSYDSTAIAGSITAVPEPTSWALMIGGFGLVGGSMRRRKISTKVSFA